ncbi:MAG: right-handed parallel beta-helix repeat-containing protein [Thermoguttaceae bacterium]
MERQVISGRLPGSGGTAWATAPLAASILVFLLSFPCTGAFGEEAPTRAAGPAKSPFSISGRAGYIAFETFGREDSILHTELLPYVQVGPNTLFNDTRFFMTDQGYFGGNVGFGYRYLVPEKNRFLGASLWYDLDDSTGEMFHQLGVSLESCGSLWDVRSNLYFPIGDFEKDYRIEVQDQRFVGNRILYTGERTFGEAMKGFDLELGLPLPTEFGRAHNISITPGTYMFFGDAAPDIYGYKVRAEGNVVRNLALQTEMTSDDTFGTTVTFGIEFVWPGGSRLEDPGDIGSRIRTDQFVHRNYNVIVSRQVDLQPDTVAVNPATGQPYTVQHVASSSGGGNLGTVDDPYHTISEAQAAGGDMIFVHGGSVLDDPLVMQPGDQILGEGISYGIEYGGFGFDLLPTVNESTARPTLLGTSGAAVTLASNSYLSGFIIDSPTGYGIAGDAVQGAVVRHVEIAGSGLDGLYLHNAGDGNTFEDLAIADAGGAGVLVDGGTGGLCFSDTAVENAAGAGVDVRNRSGAFTFDGLTVRANGGGPGVHIQDTTGEGTFEELDIETNGATGLLVRNAGGLELASGQIESVNGTAVDIEDARVDAALTRVSSSGAPVGIRIVDHDGTFLIVGDDSLGSGGLIRSAATGVVLANAGTVGFQYVDFDGNGVGIDASNTDRLGFSFARVTDSTSYGLDTMNTKVIEVVNSRFEGNGGVAGNSIRLRADAEGSFGFYVSKSTIIDTSAGALAIATTGAGDDSTLTLQVHDSQIATGRLGASGVQLDWNSPLAASILRNAFTGTGGSNTGIDVTTTSTSQLVQVAVGENTFAFDGGNDVGMRFHTSGPAKISAGLNTIDFDGANGTGMAFALAKSADVYLYKNTITDNVSGGTGILFDSMVGPSNVTLQTNTIKLLSTTSIIDRGIVFTSITDTIRLLSPMNNTVTGATVPFYAPVGTIQGHTYVNNVTVP